MLLALIEIAAEAAAQPKDGDLVFTVTQTSPTTLSYVAYVDPVNPSTVRVFSTAPSGTTISGVRMQHDNRDLVIGCNSTSGVGNLVVVDKAGKQRSLSLNGVPGYVGGFELDHAATWVASASASLGPGWNTTALVGVHGYGHRNSQVFVSRIGPPFGVFTDIAIDRDPGHAPYVAGTAAGSPPVASLLTADRRNNLSTLLPGIADVVCVELHPRSGDFLTSFSGFPRTPHGLGRVSKSGKWSLAYFSRVTAARITQDDFAWLIGGGNPSLTAVKFDLSRDAVVKTIPLGITTASAATTGIESYGYRKLVCVGSYQSALREEIRLQSRKPGDGNKLYALACSRARRPGAQLGNGEWLDLDGTDPLFLTSALNLAPSIFQDFRGTTDANGYAGARVNIPTGLPPNLGITIFVAGVIYDATGVRTVTNTHWFVL